jgi:hypothetical protein
MIRRTPLLIAALASTTMGCTPQDAIVDGVWFTWMSANTSGTVLENALDGKGDDESLEDRATIYECSGRGWNSDLDAFDPGYVGPRTEADYDDPRFIGGDCPKSGGSYESYCADHVDEMVEECEQINDLDFYPWLQEDGFYALQGSLTPWRTEGLINGEGDLQLTIHQDLGNGEDFRFGFAIDPNFNPLDCVTGEDGEPEIVQVDGSDWVEEWSADEDGYDIYYLNAGAYQVYQGSTSNEFWYLTTDWLSGFGFAKFSSDEYNSRSTAYGHYDEDGDGPEFSETNNPSFIGVLDRENPDLDAYADWADELQVRADAWELEVTEVAGAHVEGVPQFELKIEDNIWRPIDLDPAGLDGWMEMHASYVRISDDSDISEGGQVSGDYQILYDAIDSSSRILVKGTFEIPSLRTDPWAYPVLEDELRAAEGGNEYCQ